MDVVDVLVYEEEEEENEEASGKGWGGRPNRLTSPSHERDAK